MQAHPITVGKWKRQDDWAGKLASSQEKVAQKGATTPVRKKTAHDEAFRSYLEAGGKVSNQALADKVGVSGTTISNWKNAGRLEQAAEADNEIESERG